MVCKHVQCQKLGDWQGKKQLVKQWSINGHTDGHIDGSILFIGFNCIYNF